MLHFILEDARFSVLKQSTFLVLISLWVLIILIYIVSTVYYNIVWHPLARFPGPKLLAASFLPCHYQAVKGRLAFKLHELHQKYGSIVRIAPNELSFIDESAWKTIYGQGSQKCFRKNYDSFNETQHSMNQTVLTADDVNHARIRKALEKGFSPHAMKTYETYIEAHTSVLVQLLVQEAQKSDQDVDMKDWFNWTAMDIITETSFGRSFDCLTTPKHRPYAETISKFWKIIVFASKIKSLIPRFLWMRFSLPIRFLQNEVNKLECIVNLIKQRANSRRVRRSLLSNITEHDEKKELLTQSEVISNASIFVFAGTETVATVLPALLYLLCRNPRVMDRLTKEIRTSFKNESSIRTFDVNHLEYLTACINESLRLYPPIPEGLPRVCPDEGAMICGEWVPGGTFLQVSNLAACLSAKNFNDPLSFVPERWITKENPFPTDKRGSSQPFSTGPRNCIGKALAMAEVGLIISRLLWRFDVQYTGDKDWFDQPTYMLWVKKPLPVKLISVI